MSSIDSALSASEIIGIIQAGSAAGLRELVHKDLTLKFGQEIAEEKPKVQPGDGPVPIFPEAKEDEPNTLTEYLGELMLSDPSEYERIVEKEAFLDAQNDQRAKSVLRGS